MPITLTRENYDRSLLPGGFKKETIETLELGIEAGWSLLCTDRGHVTMTAPPPNEHVTYGVSVKKAQSGPVRKIRMRIRRLGDEKYKALAEEVKPKQADEEIDFHAPLLSDPTPKKKAPAPKKKAETAAPGALPEQPERTVVSEQPMIAHRGQKKGYVSETTNVRRWSDGTEDFTCRYCGQAFEQRLSVRGHWQKHVRAGEVEPYDASKVTRVATPPHEPTWTRQGGPRLARIKALAEFIKHLDMEKIEPEELAHLVLSWVAEQSNTGSGLAGEREPLTPEQIIERIRSLIDQGEYLTQRAEIDAQRARIDELEARATAAESEAQRARETLQAFRELATELDDGEEAS